MSNKQARVLRFERVLNTGTKPGRIFLRYADDPEDIVRLMEDPTVIMQRSFVETHYNHITIERPVDAAGAELQEFLS